MKTALLLGGTNRNKIIDIHDDLGVITMTKSDKEPIDYRISEERPRFSMRVETYHYVATTKDMVRLYLIESEM